MVLCAERYSLAKRVKRETSSLTVLGSSHAGILILLD